MGDTRLNHLGSILESRNGTLRREAAIAFGKYCLSDDKVVEVLLTHVCSTFWDGRVAAADTLNSLLLNMETDDGSALTESTSAIKANTHQQRLMLDQHLEMNAFIGVTSAGFLNDADMLPQSGNNSPREDSGERLTSDYPKLNVAIKVEDLQDSDSLDSSSQKALLNFLCRLFPILSDQRWQHRHGAAIAIARILSTSYSRYSFSRHKSLLFNISDFRLPLPFVDSCALQLLHVLILDQFNDFVSGRSATAPVRETCAQALGHFLYKTDQMRQSLVLSKLRTLLSMQGERNWHCRQSALLVFKYFFAVASSSDAFHDCFKLVVASLDDPVDDVVSCAVTTLSSLLSNPSVDSERSNLIQKVMSNVWFLLEQESKKEPLRTGLDALAIDLIGILETWMYLNESAVLTREQILIIVSMVDEKFQSRSQKIVTLLFTVFKRDEGVLNNDDILVVLKLFYRILLFTAPTSNMLLLENTYLTSKTVIGKYGSNLIKSRTVLDKIGPWAGCLLLDHRNAIIGYPLESFCQPSNEVLFGCQALVIPCPNFMLLNVLMGWLDVFTYCVDTSTSSRDDPNMRMASEEVRCLSDKAVQIDAPVTVLQICDAFLKAPPKNYDELTSAVNHLTMDCKEFVDYCISRGVDRNKLNLGESVSVEEISKMAFDQCLVQLTDPNTIESLTTRYSALADSIQFTKLAVKTNTTRVTAFLASALFYFGFAPEKLTPMICSSFSVDQLPEFYQQFALDQCDNEELLKSSNPALRFAGSKAVETFARSRLGDTISRIFDPLSSMLSNVSDENERRGAIEAMLRLSYMNSALNGVVSLLAPLVFVRMTDKLEEVRVAAGEAFRNMVPLLALEDVSVALVGLSEALSAIRKESADFISVLSAPGKLELVATATIRGLCKTIQLRQYQAEGITWIRFLRKFGLNGILADDMGLGKTLQTLCALALSLDNDDHLSTRCSLIVCPRTLVDHWCNEWRRFFPGRLPARRVEGTLVKLKSAEIVVAAYEDLKGNASLGNPKTSLWRAANELKSTSRLILSGTPFLRKVLKCRSHKASEKDIQEGSEAVTQLHRLILPFIMRRLKSEVLRELPDKNVQDVECQLSDVQRTIYKFIVDRCTANRLRLASRSGISPLHALTALRKLVDHPILVQDVLSKLGAPESIMSTLSSASSGKMAALGQLFSEAGIGITIEREDLEDDDPLSSIPMEMPHRALIFCQWKSSVQLISNALARGNFGAPISHLVLDGSVDPSERQSIVDRFNTDHLIDVLVLTTHIGGVGLNLTGADVVIFLDHDWNPMKDLQAIDRAHRIGQTRKVNVYRLITQGTIEEKVMSLHKFKQGTADALIGADNRSLQTMATDELMNMFILDGEQPSTENGRPDAKRKRKSASSSQMSGANDEDKWNLAELWDESQYEQQFDVSQFIKDAV
uniref:DUF3535 domain-containing protein n=1 Tax=Angiostrongylus cantonensis TaxID=6313 RepID=A0A0K0DDV5_ANGCA